MKYCPRLDHNVRLSPTGKVQSCGHMTNSPMFDSIDQLVASQWRNDLKDMFQNNEWPKECIRCQQTEEVNGTSIRLYSLDAHAKYIQDNSNYLFVTGLLDNVCNSACISCSEESSTYIGKLKNNVIIINNENLFSNLDIKNILVFEITGGEPSVSVVYKNTLRSLTSATKYVRINTNGAKFIPELIPLLDNGVEVTITMSLDGLDKLFEYTRWPLSWDDFRDTQQKYQNLAKQYSNFKLNFWTTVSVLNITNLEKIIDYSADAEIPMSYAILNHPSVLNVKYKNSFTAKAKETLLNSLKDELKKLANLVATDVSNDKQLNGFIEEQDKIRKININNFLEL